MVSKSKTCISALISIIFLLGSHSVFAAQADIDAEVAEYTAVFKADNFAEHRRVINKLVWAGHQSSEFYDVIADRLQSMQDANDKVGRQQASWFAKALSFSGDTKYRSALEATANSAKNKKVRKHAQAALVRMETYANWNPLISRDLDSAPTGRLEEGRIKNMLAAEDPGLLIIGAKRVYHGHKSDSELVAHARTRLEQEWPNADSGSDQQVDAVAWLIKVMAESGVKSNRGLLEQIATESKSKKVRKYAKKYADYL